MSPRLAPSLAPLTSLLLLCAACGEREPAAPAAPAPQATAPAPSAEAPHAANPHADPMKGLPQIPEVELPTFTDVPEGPRAPSRQALTFTVGATTQAQAQEFIAQHKLACRDTSPRAMFIAIYNQYKEKGAAGMHAMHGGANPHAANPHAANPHAANPHAANPHAANPHAANPHAANPHAAHGDNPHAAHGEDLAKTGGHAHGDYTEKAKNPQIRLSCEGAPTSAFTDRERPEATGRLLLTFDSDKHPLRLVSYSRQHKDAKAARADFEASIKAAEATYGKPTESEGELGEGGFDGFVNVRRVWRFADLQVVVTGTGLGPNGAQIEERLDVPLPVRVDAPSAATP